MALNSYENILLALARQCHATNLTADINDLFAQGEARIYRRLRIRPMEVTLSVTMSAIAPLPLRWLGLKHAHTLETNTNKVMDLDHQAPEYVYRKYPNRNAQSRPRVVAIDASSFIFGPVADKDYVLQGTYWARLTALSTANSTNWFVENAPDLLMAAAKVEIYGFKEDTTQEDKWEKKFEMIASGLVTEEKRNRRSNMPRSMKPDVQVR